MMETNFKEVATVYMGGDHAGYEYKKIIKKTLEAKGFTIDDKGTYAADSVDYPDFAHPVAEAVEQDKHSFGILICGSGNGVCMSANKHKGIRAALCWNEELAALARQHNNANILCIPARFVSEALAEKMVEVFTTTDFEGGRHERRVEKIGR